VKPSNISPAAFAALMVLLALGMDAATKGGSLCSLDHYPVAAGDVNEYRTTSNELDADGGVVSTTSTVYKERVIAVDSDRYRVETTMVGNTSESTWLCSAQGLAMQIDEVPAMSITTTGPSIPATMEIGAEWTQTFEMKGPGISTRITTVNRVAAREEITVPAGTFDAFRVDYEAETAVEGEAPSVTRGTQWFAVGIGVVRSTSVSDVGAEGISRVETTLELLRRTTK
jgi:hypothetical protein